MKVISLFSNIGIAETYLKEIGFEILLANDICRKRINIFSKFYPDTIPIHGDFSERKIFNQIVKISGDLKPDIILATPPCQGMSTAGEQKKNDFRNNLTVNLVEYIKIIKPKYIFLENVPLFLKTSIMVKNKKILIRDFIKNELSNTYKINSEIVDMSHFSIPQKRFRTIVLLSKKTLSREWKIPDKDKKIISLKDAIGSLPSLDPYIKDLSIEENLKIFPQYEKKKENGLKVSKWHKPPHHLKRHVISMMHTPTGSSAFSNKFHKPLKTNGEIVRGYKNTYKRQSWHMPAYTVTMDNVKISSQENVHPGRKIGENNFCKNMYSDPRVFSLYELIIISSLPKSWDIPEKISESFLRRLIGEGIPPLFVKKVFKELIV